MTSQNKNGRYSVGTWYGEPYLYGEISISLIEVKKSENTSGEAYVQPSNANRRALLTF